MSRSTIRLGSLDTVGDEELCVQEEEGEKTKEEVVSRKEAEQGFKYFFLPSGKKSPVTVRTCAGSELVSLNTLDIRAPLNFTCTTH